MEAASHTNNRTVSQLRLKVKAQVLDLLPAARSLYRGVCAAAGTLGGEQRRGAAAEGCCGVCELSRCEGSGRVSTSSSRGCRRSGCCSARRGVRGFPLGTERAADGAGDLPRDERRVPASKAEQEAEGGPKWLHHRRPK